MAFGGLIHRYLRRLGFRVSFLKADMSKTSPVDSRWNVSFFYTLGHVCALVNPVRMAVNVPGELTISAGQIFVTAQRGVGI